jgi:2-polyprenyl-3-methyl-5-hydroxy-6-metoxy-1,4-benzoquinol methylase
VATGLTADVILKMGYEQLTTSSGGWTYDGLRIQADLETHQYVVEYARALPAGVRVLDVGAGTGALAKQLVDIGCRVSCTSWNDRVAVPVPAYRIDLDAAFSVASVGGEPYDLVTCVEVIEHVENPSALLRSLRDVVRPGGHVIVSTPNVESAQARIQWLLRGCPLIFSGQEVERNRHISMMWRQGLEFLIDRTGFDIESRQMLAGPRLRSTLQSLVKRPLYAVMDRLLLGDTFGETRLYVLRPGSRAAQKSGPGDVY